MWKLFIFHITISTVLHNRVPLFCMASHMKVTQGCQRIPSCDVAAFNRWTPSCHKRERREKGKKRKKKLVLCLKILHISILPHTHVHTQISSLCLNGTYLEKSSWLFYQRYWTYPSVSIFFTHFIQKRILKNNKKGMRRKKKIPSYGNKEEESFFEKGKNKTKLCKVC